MEKIGEWAKSLSVVLAVLLTMTAAGYFMLTGENEVAHQGVVAEAAPFTPVKIPQEEKHSKINQTSEPGEEVPAVEKTAAGQETAKETVAVDPGYKAPVIFETSAVPVEHEAESKPAVTVTEAPAAQPAANEMPAVVVEEPLLTAAPVSYNWSSAASYIFRMEVKVTNNSSETAKNVYVSVPLLENSSPYQATSLKSVNFDIVSSSGRVRTFNLGDIAPGETKIIVADFDIYVRSFSLNSSNETLDQARKIFEQYAGPGNCRDLALAFIKKCREQGIAAREVIGFARTQRGAMTAGSLQGSRHSWAEINVDGLGWVPVDLTFQYFGAFPYTSHIVESYGDQSVKITYTGGSLSAGWSNAVL